MEIEFSPPDDWHVHLRDDAAMVSVLPFTARQFRRAVVMPNLRPPVTTVLEAKSYRDRILHARPDGSLFEPLMTLYLRDTTAPEEIYAAKESGFVVACKLYPSGATTNSDAGVTNIRAIDDVLSAMSECSLPLLVHGEVTRADIDIFHREAVFVQVTLPQILNRHPKLKVVLEHISTKVAADFVREASDNLGATITAHHLLENRNAMLAGGIKPHYYCLPILKTEKDRLALLEAATSGDPKFFLGTDSAPHSMASKESACGCAGSFTAYDALSLYAEAFDSIDCIDKLPDFASRFGADFYGLPQNEGRCFLRKEEWVIPEQYQFEDSTVIPFRAGQRLLWRFYES